MSWHHHDPGDVGERPADHAVPLPKQLSSDFIVLDPAGLHFTRDGGKLRLAVDGEEPRNGVAVFRLFPLTEPDNWLSVVDSSGREVGIIENLRDLDKDSRRFVREDLDRRYVVPQILRILSCTERFDLVHLEVETDRGRRRFVSRELRENIKEPTPGRIILTDVDGNRFDIPDYASLDPRSRSLIEQYL